MDGKPDLIIGNYTDGNLAATLMANKLGITQVSLLVAFFAISVFDCNIIICTNSKWSESRQLLHMLWRRQNMKIQTSSGRN